MARPKKPASADPLFAAMIAKLPPADKAWDVDKQVSWLNMMAMAFGTVYGGNAAEKLACKCHETLPQPLLFGGPAGGGMGPPGQVPQKFARNGAAEPEPRTSIHPFYIDPDGYARNKKGVRVLKSDTHDYIADMRGEDGDPNAVVWADETVGPPDVPVTIG